VGIILAYALLGPPPLRNTGDEFASRGAIAIVGIAWRRIEGTLQVRIGHGQLATHLILDGRPLAYEHVSAREGENGVVGHVVAERPENAIDDGIRRRLHA